MEAKDATDSDRARADAGRARQTDALRLMLRGGCRLQNFKPALFHVRGLICMRAECDALAARRKPPLLSTGDASSPE